MNEILPCPASIPWPSTYDSLLGAEVKMKTRNRLLCAFTGPHPWVGGHNSLLNCAEGVGCSIQGVSSVVQGICIAVIISRS